MNMAKRFAMRGRVSPDIRREGLERQLYWDWTSCESRAGGHRAMMLGVLSASMHDRPLATIVGPRQAPPWEPGVRFALRRVGATRVCCVL